MCDDKERVERIRRATQKSIDDHERILARIEKQASDPEIWAESGYYLQKDIDAERSYLMVMYHKLHSR